MAALTMPVYTDMAGTTVTAEATLLTPSTGKRFILKGIQNFKVDTTATYQFKDGASGTVIFTLDKIACAAANDNGGDNIDFTMGGQFPGLRSSAANNLLRCIGSTGTPKVFGIIISVEE